jgi:hypothetical protein
MEINKIKTAFKQNRVYYSRHALQEMRNDEFGRIFENDVFEAVLSGEIIQKYPEDKPFPSILVFGVTKENRPIHMVCAYNSSENLLIIITVYQPDPNLWINFKRRQKP